MTFINKFLVRPLTSISTNSLSVKLNKSSEPNALLSDVVDELQSLIEKAISQGNSVKARKLSAFKREIMHCNYALMLSLKVQSNDDSFGSSFDIKDIVNVHLVDSLSPIVMDGFNTHLTNTEKDVIDFGEKSAQAKEHYLSYCKEALTPHEEELRIMADAQELAEKQHIRDLENVGKLAEFELISKAKKIIDKLEQGQSLSAEDIEWLKSHEADNAKLKLEDSSVPDEPKVEEPSKSKTHEYLPSLTERYFDSDTEKKAYLTTVLQKLHALSGGVVLQNYTAAKDALKHSIKESLSELGHVSLQVVLLVGAILTSFLGVEIVQWYRIGVEVLDIAFVGAILFALVPICLSKVLSLIFRGDIYKMESSRLKSYKPLGIIKAIGIGIVLLAISGSLSLYSTSQIKIERDKMLDKTIEDLNAQQTISFDDVARGSYLQNEGISKPSFDENLHLYQRMNVKADFLFQLLLVIVLLLTSAFMFAMFDVKLKAYLSRKKYQRAKAQYLEAMTSYETTRTRRQETIRQISHIYGLLCLHQNEMKTYGIR